MVTSEHVDAAHLVDLVRKALPPASHEPISQHLETNCPKCSAEARAWQSLADFAASEKMYQPPESASRIAYSFFGAASLKASVWPRLEVALLKFDSLVCASHPNVRTLRSPVCRQLLYKCGTICIDIRIEQKPGSNKMYLTGQVLDAIAPETGTVEATISLVGPNSTISETTTNQFGEFYFDLHTGKSMRLFVGTNSRALVVPIPDTEREAA